MEKKLIITEISATLVRITCEGGRVLDTRNGATFTEVVCKKEEIGYYKAE